MFGFEGRELREGPGRPIHVMQDRRKTDDFQEEAKKNDPETFKALDSSHVLKDP